MTARQLALFPEIQSDSDGPGDLERAAHATIDALRAQSAIQPWHELDCQIVLELSRDVGTSRGIAKSQMFAALLAARAKLPEPVVSESDEAVIEYEAERELEWMRAHEPRAIASDIQDAEIIG